MQVAEAPNRVVVERVRPEIDWSALRRQGKFVELDQIRRNANNVSNSVRSSSSLRAEGQRSANSARFAPFIEIASYTKG